MGAVKLKRILITTYYEFPCRHPVLESVFAKEIAKKCDIYWIFSGKKTGDMQLKWHNSQVILAPVFGKGLSKAMFYPFNSVVRLFAVMQCIISKKIDIIILRDLPIEATFCVLIRRIFRLKVFYQNSAPLEEISIAYARSLKGFRKFWWLLKGYAHRFFVGQAMRHADLIFVISDFHKDALAISVEERKLVVLPMGIDNDWINDVRQDNPALQLKPDGRPVISYFGTLNPTRNPEFLLWLAKELKRNISAFTFYIIGKSATDDEDKRLMKKCTEMGLDDTVVFTGHIDRARLKSYLLASDLTVSAIPPKSYYVNSSPTKVYESLGNGIPVVGNQEILEQCNVLRSSGGGLAVKYDVKEFATAVLYILNDKDARIKMGRDGKTFVKHEYDYKVLASRIETHFS